MTDDHGLGAWAHTYDGYARIAGPRHIARIIEPVRLEYEATGAIPEWAGVDLLRGWAFMLVRAHRHGGYRSLVEDYPQILAIADAVARHPAATDADRPPPRTRT